MPTESLQNCPLQHELLDPIWKKAELCVTMQAPGELQLSID